jgi:hypothetical protein
MISQDEGDTVYSGYNVCGRLGYFTNRLGWFRLG